MPLFFNKSDKDYLFQFPNKKYRVSYTMTTYLKLPTKCKSDKMQLPTGYNTNKH